MNTLTRAIAALAVVAATWATPTPTATATGGETTTPVCDNCSKVTSRKMGVRKFKRDKLGHAPRNIDYAKKFRRTFIRQVERKYRQHGRTLAGSCIFDGPHACALWEWRRFQAHDSCVAVWKWTDMLTCGAAVKPLGKPNLSGATVRTVLCGGGGVVAWLAVDEGGGGPWAYAAVGAGAATCTFGVAIEKLVD